MSRDFLLDYLQHSWGKKPEQKAREKEYNKEYYQKHKDKWKKLNNKNWSESILKDIGKINRRALNEKIAADEADRALALIDNQYRNSRDNIAEFEVFGDKLRKSLGDKEIDDAIASNRRKMVSSGAARNEASKAQQTYSKNAKNYKDKAFTFSKLFTKDMAKRYSAEAVKSTIDAGKKFVSNLLDKIF